MSGIRIARKDDLEGIVALMEKYYEYDRHNFNRKNACRGMRRLLADPARGRVFLAADKSSAVGYLALAFGYSLEYHGRDAFVDEFFILEKYMGKGLGSKMLARAEKAAKKLGVRAINLEVARHNEPVLRFYRREGFKDHDRHLATKRV
ncbi:MAG: GNAT family N-acetyltransferase [Nitrososphaera sp.]|uniref:GNAT family N-acetyltransferase n=1 Tax=Nitrososphaera sp. TaxID=1971748 RepID=UPI003D6DC58C